MYVLVRDRGQGKTTALVEWMLEDETRSRAIVISSESSAEYTRHIMRKVCLAKGLDVREEMRHVYSAGAVTRGVLRGRHFKEVGIDDVENVLQVLLGLHNPQVTVVTTSGVVVDRVPDSSSRPGTQYGLRAPRPQREHLDVDHPRL